MREIPEFLLFVWYFRTSREKRIFPEDRYIILSFFCNKSTFSEKIKILNTYNNYMSFSLRLLWYACINMRPPIQARYAYRGGCISSRRAGIDLHRRIRVSAIVSRARIGFIENFRFFFLFFFVDSHSLTVISPIRKERESRRLQTEMMRSRSFTVLFPPFGEGD